MGLSIYPGPRRGQANGVASLDATTRVPVQQLPDAVVLESELPELGVADGFVVLDSSGKVPVTQIPSTVAFKSDIPAVEATLHPFLLPGI